jgi:hypothetical protein
MNRKMFQAGGASNTLGSYDVFDKSTGKTTTINPGFLQNIRLKSQIAYPLLNGYKSGQLQLGEGILQELDTYRQSDEPFGISGDLSSPARVDDLGTAAFDLSRGLLRGAEGPLRGIAGFVGELTGSDRLKDISSIDFRTGRRKEFEPLVPTREENRSQVLEELLERELAQQTPITDFQEDIEQIKSPTPVIAGENKSFDFIDDDMRSKVGQSEYDTNLARIEQEIKDDPISQTLGIANFDVDERRKAFEKAIEGRDEFGELIPTDRPPTPGMPPESLSPGLDEIDVLVEDIMPTETLVQNKFGVDDIQPSLLKVDTSITDADLQKFNEAEPPDAPKETTGIFGSDRFLDFVRNVGAGLVSTGQMGEGLAVGAAKAAEERTARDLLKEQEETDFNRKMAIALAGNTPESLNAKQTIEFANEVKRDISDFEGGLAATGFTDYAIEIIEDAQSNNKPVGGLKGFLAKMVDKGFAFAGMPKDFKDMSADSKVETLLRVVKQKNLQAILGESGRTISDKDRQIIEEVFGSLGAFTNTDAVLGTLYESRRGLAQANLERKARIESNLPYLAKYGTDGITFYNQSLPSLKRILGIDPVASQADIARAQFAGNAIPGFETTSGIPTIDL